MEEEDVVFFDKLPDLNVEEPNEDDYFQDELDEMVEWKGPVGVPHFKGKPKKNHTMPLFKKQSNNIKPHKKINNNNAPFDFHAMNAEMKSNFPNAKNGKKGVSPNSQNKGRSYNNNINEKFNKMKAPQKKAKCKVFSVPLGIPSEDEKDNNKITNINKKTKNSNFSQNKEVKTFSNLPPKEKAKHNDDIEQHEEFLGNEGFHFNKKRKESNNLFMKNGVNRNQYLNNHMKIIEPKETPKGGVNFPPRNNIVKKQVVVNSKSKSPKPLRPYVQKKKTGGYKSSKSPNRKAPTYQKYTPTQPPNSNNAYRSLNENQSYEKNNFQKDIKDKRSKELLAMDDFKMPKDALSSMTKRIVKIEGNQRIKTVRKIFSMKNGTQEVHENVYVEKIDQNK